MPALDDFIIGPIAGVYVGLFNDGSDPIGNPYVPLTQLDAPRTQGGRYRYTKPCQFEVGARDDCQPDLCTVSMDLTFYWSTEACIVAMTNDLTDPAVKIDDVPVGYHYTILLLAPNKDTDASILLPECVSKCLIENPFMKTEGTILPINFNWSERNKNIKIQNRGTYAELKALLGAQSPI